MQIKTSLPTFGNSVVSLHKESAQILEFFGNERERERLAKIPHLGVAASCFTGIKHSRLEYVLLQIAVIELVSKLQRSHPLFALSNDVVVPGLSERISSGEELLKSWVILRNVGHLQNTFGTESVVLRFARANPEFGKWISTGCVGDRLASWSRSVITEFRVNEARFLITLLRVSVEKPYDRRKKLIRRLVEALVCLPENSQEVSREAFEKLQRLRSLSDAIRLLCLVSLDSYYSHQPTKIDISSTLQALRSLADWSDGRDFFGEILPTIAGWLADEIYLHPTAVSALKDYQIKGGGSLQRQWKDASLRPELREAVLSNLLLSGFGPPRLGKLDHFLRLSFSPRKPMLGRGDSDSVEMQLNKELALRGQTFVSVQKNEFSGEVHVDFHITSSGVKLSTVAEFVSRIFHWLIKILEADALAAVRRMTRHDTRTSETTSQIYSVVFPRLLKTHSHLLSDLFHAFLKFLLRGSDMTAHFHSSSIGKRSKLVIPIIKDQLGRRFSTATASGSLNPQFLPSEYASSRDFERQVVTNIGNRSRGELKLLVLDSVTIRKHAGESRDEWDGAVLIIDKSSLRLVVVEAKDVGTNQAKQSAFKQLKETRLLLKRCRGMSTRRKRVAGGALLEVRIPFKKGDPVAATQSDKSKAAIQGPEVDS